MSRQKYTFVTLSSSVPVPGVAASLRSPCYGPCQDRSDSLSLSEAPTRSAVDTVGSTSCVSATTSQVNGARAGGGHGEVEHCVGGHSSRDPIRSEDSRVASQAVGTITQTATRGDKAPVGPCEALRTVSPFPTVQKKFGELLPFSGTSLSGEADKTLASLHSSEPLTRPRQSIDTAAEAPGSGTQGARLPVPACLDGDGDERKSAGLLPGNDLGSSGKGILAACSPKEKLCGSQGVSFCEGDSSSSVSKREGVSFSFSLQNRSSLSSGNVSEVRLVGPQRTVYSSSLRVPSLALPSSFEDAPLPAVAREDAAAMLRDFATLLQRLERLGSHHRQLQQSIQIRSCSVSSSSPQLSAVSRAELVEARRQLKQHAVVCASVSARLGRLFSEDHEMISAHGTNSAAARTTQGNGEENKKNNGMSMLVQGHDSRTEEEKSSLRLGDSKRTDEATGRGSDEGGAAANQRRRLLLSKLRQDFLRLQQHHERLMLLFDSHAFSLHLEEPSEHCLVRSSGPRQEEGSGPNLLVKKERGQTPGLLALIDFGHFAQHESGVTDNSGPRADRSDCSRATLCGVASGPGIAEAGLVTCSKDDSKGHPQRFDEHTSCNRSCSGERRQCLQPTCVAPPTSASSSSSFSSVRSPSCSGAGGLAEPRFLPLPAPEELPSSPLASSFCSFWRPTCLQEVDEGLEEAQRREQLQQLRQLEQCVNVLHELHLQVASDVAAAEEPLLAAADEGESACVEIAQANRELISASMRRSRWWGVQGGGAAAAAGAIVGVVAGGPIGLAAGAVVGAFLGASSGTALKREHRRKLTGLKKEIEGRRRGRRERREGGDGRAGVTFGPGDSQTGVLLEDVSDTFCHSEGPFNQHTSSQSCLCPPEVSSSCPTGTLSSAPGLRSPPVLSSCRSHPRLSGSHSGAQFSSSRFRGVWTPSLAAFGVAAAPRIGAYGRSSRGRTVVQAHTPQSPGSVSSSVFASSSGKGSLGSVHRGRSERSCTRVCGAADAPFALSSERHGTGRLEVCTTDSTMRYRRVSADPRVCFSQSSSTMVAGQLPSRDECWHSLSKSNCHLGNSACIPTMTCMTTTSATALAEGEKGRECASAPIAGQDKSTWQSIFSFKPSVFAWPGDSQVQVDAVPTGQSSCREGPSHHCRRDLQVLASNTREQQDESYLGQGLHKRTASGQDRSLCGGELPVEPIRSTDTDTRTKTTSRGGDEVVKHRADNRRASNDERETAVGAAVWGARGRGGFWSGPSGAWQWNALGSGRRMRAKGRQKKKEPGD